ncbi:hypothetical protein VTK73DRAFT_7559 [Phialemonium thermophilum]|uniref:Uncharacterized protein n=1 Tax=Phialemonium thermophilum TaxID=223376 RepID=A0ABR3XTE5_9PEZI
MPSTYTINEPHPTVPQNSYTHSGRGGAGNTFRAPATTPSTGIPTRSKPHPQPPVKSSGRFYSGRGGAGNVHSASARLPALSLDEEYARASAREKASIVHVGRGGAGNIISSGGGSLAGAAPLERKYSTSSSVSSADSHASTRSRLWGRLTGALH